MGKKGNKWATDSMKRLAFSGKNCQHQRSPTFNRTIPSQAGGIAGPLREQQVLKPSGIATLLVPKLAECSYQPCF